MFQFYLYVCLYIIIYFFVFPSWLFLWKKHIRFLRWYALFTFACLLTLKTVQKWGNPFKEEYYHYMKSYSPQNNVRHYYEAHSVFRCESWMSSLVVSQCWLHLEHFQTILKSRVCDLCLLTFFFHLFDTADSSL